jgi:RNA polymerase sigma factor (sigma-70 family)
MIAIAATLNFNTDQINVAGLDDHALVQLCLTGRPAAWNVLVERYRKLVYSIPMQLGLVEADADDVFQSVFLTLHRFLGTLRDRTRLSAWLITTTRRECYRLIKRRRRDGAFPLEVFEAEGETVDQQTERWEQQQLVRRALEKLGERDRRLVTLLFLEQGTPNYEAIADELGMRVGSIGPTRARILAKLEKILAEMGLGSETLETCLGGDGPEAAAA